MVTFSSGRREGRKIRNKSEDLPDLYLPVVLGNKDNGYVRCFSQLFWEKGYGCVLENTKA